MAVDVLLGLMVAAGVCLVAWRQTVVWRGLLLCGFVYLAANIDPRADLLIYIGLLCWGLLCLIESGGRLAFSALNFTVLAVFGVLVKANFLFVAGLSAAVIVSDLVLRGRRGGALALVVSLCTAFALGWRFSGQDLSGLGHFFGNAWSIIQGYDQVVGLDGLETLKSRGLLTAVLAMGTVIIRALAAFGEPAGTSDADRAPERDDRGGARLFSERGSLDRGAQRRAEVSPALPADVLT